MIGIIHYFPDSQGNPKWSVKWYINVDGRRSARARTFAIRRDAEAFVRKLSVDGRARLKAEKRIVIKSSPKNKEQDI